MMKFILAFAFLFSFQAHAAQTVLQGTHDDMDYLIAMSDEWEDVNGSWGDDRKYNLAWDSWDLVMKGKTLGAGVDFYYDSVYKAIFMESDCGYSNIYLDIANNRASGTYCDNLKWSQDYASKADMTEQLSQLFLKEMLRFFPEPTKLPVLNFFMPKLVKALNSENVN